MAALSEGDIVVLVSGSPRFVVESIQSTKVSCVWCNEGIIHRDTFDMSILRKWEASDTAPGRGGDRGGRGGDRGGDRGGFKSGDRGGKPGGFKGGDRGGPPKRDFDKKDKPFFRKD
jgi:uncharacterized protein YodC (DUF2158 family)